MADLLLWLFATMSSPDGNKAFQVALMLVATLTAAACDSNATGPTGMSAVTIGTPSPAAGATITASANFIARGSGALLIPITVSAASDLPWAQLYVFLLTPNNPSGYCGSNIPDAPTWMPFKKGTQSFSISGFQVFGLPCQVIGLRAIFHTRGNTNNLTPPPASEIVAEATVPVTYTIR